MRALVSFFAALLIIISLYQLSFTWFVNKHESAMAAKAKQYVNRIYPAAKQVYPVDKEAQALYDAAMSKYGPAPAAPAKTGFFGKIRR